MKHIGKTKEKQRKSKGKAQEKQRKSKGKSKEKQRKNMGKTKVSSVHVAVAAVGAPKTVPLVPWCLDPGALKPCKNQRFSSMCCCGCNGSIVFTDSIDSIDFIDSILSHRVYRFYRFDGVDCIDSIDSIPFN